MKKSLSAAFIAAVLVTGLTGQIAFAHGLNLGADVDGEVGVKKGQNNGGLFSNLKATFLLKGDHNNDGHPDNGDRGNGKKNGHHKDDADHDDDNDGANEDRIDRVSGVARVTAVSSTTITAEKAVGSSERTIVLSTDDDTEFLLRSGDDADIDDVDEGDIVTFRGEVTSRTDAEVRIDASHVRIWGDLDLSARAEVTGEVTSVDEGDSQLVIETEDDETVTVNMTDLTTIVDEDGDANVFADIAVGATVKIKGWWDSLKETITAVKVRIL